MSIPDNSKKNVSASSETDTFFFAIAEFSIESGDQYTGAKNRKIFRLIAEFHAIQQDDITGTTITIKNKEKEK